MFRYVETLLVSGQQAGKPGTICQQHQVAEGSTLPQQIDRSCTGEIGCTRSGVSYRGTLMGGRGKKEGWGEGQLTCGYPLPLAPTDPPDDVIAHQRILALLQANNIRMGHNSTV